MAYQLPFIRNIKQMMRPKGIAFHPRPASGIAHMARPRSPIRLDSGGMVMPNSPDIPIGVSQDDPLAGLFAQSPGFGLVDNSNSNTAINTRNSPLQNPWVQAGLGALAGATGAAGNNLANLGRPAPIMTRSQDNPYPIPLINRTTDPVTQVVTQHVFGYKPWNVKTKMASGGPVMAGANREAQKRQVFLAAVQAMQGQSQNPMAAFQAFASIFGPNALAELKQHIAGIGGQPPMPQGGGAVQGPGDGMSDSVPAQHTQTGQPIALSGGEYVVSAPDVSLIGNGSTDAGAKKIQAGIAKLRQKKYGRRQQLPAVSGAENVALGLR